MKPELIILGIATFGITLLLITSGPETTSTISRGGGCTNSIPPNKSKVCIRNKEWKIKSATGNGSCLFNAVMGFLYAEKNVKITREIEKNFAKTLRNDVLSFYKKNKNVVGPAGMTWNQLIEGDATSFDEYLERMSHTSAWGGQVEISAIATILGRSVYIMDSSFNIHKSYGQKMIDSNKNPIYLYYTGSHFDYLVRRPIPS
jgi:hypothetical protein